MGKNKKKNAHKVITRKTVILLILAVLLAAVLAVELFYLPRQAQNEPVPSGTTPLVQATLPMEIQQETISPLNLGYGLEIDRAGSYTGAYMEDGSDEIVSGVMMIVVTNASEDDLQLADIEVAYFDTAYTFQVTNLPAGQSVVLLEKNRAAYREDTPISAVMENVVFFSEPMSVHSDMLEISGMDGALNVKNISAEDISGTIYVYYKYSAADLLYGGVTFRAKVEGGLAAGELRQVMSSHYSPAGCTINLVTITAE